jgi:regulatory protein
MAQLEEIRRVVTRILTRRDHSHVELIQKLRIRGYEREEIEIVITEFAQNGMLCEQRFAENYVYWRKGRGYGPLRIQQELQSKGITAEIIAGHLDMSGDAWLTEIRRVWKKHFKEKMPADFQERAKQMRFLQYRGCTMEQIESIFE